ncbi:hypothetical protein GCM10025853_11240 [Tetragenococcus halophilus subsp. halophilus DSM 20339]|nr:hypothetical protein GCM10025853_11240 [Tetragenococcus halophilus subsp. halophilus DSM 20339]
MSTPLVLASKEFYLMLVQLASKRTKKRTTGLFSYLAFQRVAK